jgi:hypothetical protein
LAVARGHSESYEERPHRCRRGGPRLSACRAYLVVACFDNAHDSRHGRRTAPGTSIGLAQIAALKQTRVVSPITDVIGPHLERLITIVGGSHSCDSAGLDDEHRCVRAGVGARPGERCSAWEGALLHAGRELASLQQPVERHAPNRD